MSKFHLEIAVEHPVLFLSDPTAEETIPSDVAGAAVTATDDCICFLVQSYFDGDAQVTISDQACEKGVACFSGTISTPGKTVALSDSSRFVYLNVPVTDIETQVDVWVSDAAQPEWTWVKLPIAGY